MMVCQTLPRSNAVAGRVSGVPHQYGIEACADMPHLRSTARKRDGKNIEDEIPTTTELVTATTRL
jgi:hypothetical protein